MAVRARGLKAVGSWACQSKKNQNKRKHGQISCSKELLELLAYLAFDVVVVACERVEGPQLGPADTQFLLRILLEATDVCSHQWDPQEVKRQHTWRRQPQDHYGLVLSFRNSFVSKASKKKFYTLC